MVKKYKGKDIPNKAPPQGNGILIFGNGFKAEVSEVKEVEKDGQKILEFYLNPFLSTRRMHNIDTEKDLDKYEFCVKYYPKEYVVSLNTYDPSRRALYFTVLDWEGKETEIMEWWKGKKQVRKIEELRDTIRELRANVEKLKEKNFMLETDMEGYIKKNFDTLIKPIMPAFRNLFVGKEE